MPSDDIMTGIWETESEATAEEADEDGKLLLQILNQLPEEVRLVGMEVIVNGRRWGYRSVDGSLASGVV